MLPAGRTTLEDSDRRIRCFMNSAPQASEPEDALPLELIQAVRLAASKAAAGRPRRMMGEKKFWSLIDVMGGSVDRGAVHRLRETLTELSRPKVEALPRCRWARR